PQVAYLVEALEYPVPGALRYADTEVLYADDRFVLRFVKLAADDDPAAPRRVLYCVHDKVRHDLPDTLFVSYHGHATPALQDQLVVYCRFKALPERARKQLQTGNGGAQFMAGQRDKIVFTLFELLPLGDVSYHLA